MNYNIKSAKLVPLSAYVTADEFSARRADQIWGNAFERALHVLNGENPYVSAKGEIDLRIKVDTSVVNFNCCECKTGAGELRNDCKGNKYMIYCPVVDLDKPLYEQEGFVILRSVFIEGLKTSEVYRDTKKTTNGYKIHAIQTFWNHSKNSRHGRKIFALLDMLYNNGMTIQDYIDSLE